MRQFGHIQTIDQRYYQKIKSFATVSVVSHSDDLRDPIFDTLVALSDKDEYNSNLHVIQTTTSYYHRTNIKWGASKCSDLSKNSL